MSTGEFLDWDEAPTDGNWVAEDKASDQETRSKKSSVKQGSSEAEGSDQGSDSKPEKEQASPEVKDSTDQAQAEVGETLSGQTPDKTKVEGV